MAVVEHVGHSDTSALSCRRCCCCSPSCPSVCLTSFSSFRLLLLCLQGADRQKYKTRSGETVRLVDVLDEAKARAKAQLMERKAAAAATSAAAAAGGAAPAAAAPVVVDDAAMDHTAAVLGYGGVKYFDLRLNRTSDYVFDYDRMLR